MKNPSEFPWTLLNFYDENIDLKLSNGFILVALTPAYPIVVDME
jgi:hypothetical protein